MIHDLNNLPKEYDVILNGLENRLMATEDDALMIDVSKKLNRWYQKYKNKKEAKVEKEKALDAQNKQHKEQCRKCGNYGHKPGGQRCPENKDEKEENNKKTKK